MEENVNMIVKNEITDDQKFAEDHSSVDDENILQELSKFTEQEKAFWEQLLDDVIWDFCLDVHKTIKLNALFLDPDLDPDAHSENEEDTEEQEEIEKDASGQKKKKNNHKKKKQDIETSPLNCPKCKEMTTVGGLGHHLLKCMGLSRNSSREANKKMTADADENEFDDGPSTSSGRRKHKKFLRKRLLKSNLPGWIPSKHNLEFQRVSEDDSFRAQYLDSTDDFEIMTSEEKELFLNEKCGVMNEINERCENPFNCTQHTDEEKELTRNHLSNLDDESNEEFDFDFTDKDGFFVI